MKIISKHRDYYDHMVSKYGFDESRVYDRRGKIVHDPFACWDESLISICGVYYPIVAHQKTRKLFFEPDKHLPHGNLVMMECGEFLGLKKKHNSRT